MLGVIVMIFVGIAVGSIMGGWGVLVMGLILALFTFQNLSMALSKKQRAHLEAVNPRAGYQASLAWTMMLAGTATATIAWLANS